MENNSNTTSQALMHTRIQIKGSVKKKQQQKNIVRQQWQQFAIEMLEN